MKLSVDLNRNGILAGGNFILDYVKLIDAWPEQDTLASIHSESISNGGGPFNILKDLARLEPDLPRSAVGLVGDDLNGQWIFEDCQNAGINTDQLHRTGQAATSYTDAMTVKSTGRRTFFHQRGANALLSADHFDFARTRARLFCLGYLMLLDQLDVIETSQETGASRVLAAAREAGLVTAVDCVSQTGPNFRDVVLAALRTTDILLINEFEMGQVLGRSVNPDCEGLTRAADDLIRHAELPSTQIVIHSANGAVVVSADGDRGNQAAVAIPAQHVVGANGAGDAFAAGYLLGVHHQRDVATCLQQGVCVAAMSLTDATPSGGMKSLAECMDLGQRFGFVPF